MEVHMAAASRIPTGVFVARDIGGDEEAPTSTDDIIFVEKDLTRWTPEKIRTELDKSKSVVNSLFREIERQISKTGSIPDFTPLLEREVRRLRKISSLAQGFLEAQRDRSTACIALGYQEVAALAQLAAAAALWATAGMEFCMLRLEQTPQVLTRPTAAVASAQTFFSQAATFLGSKSAAIEGEKGEAIRIDEESRDFLDRISGAQANWRIKAESYAAESREAFQIEDQIHALRERFGKIPSREMLKGYLRGYNTDSLRRLAFSRSDVGIALAEAARDVLNESAAALRIQRAYRRLDTKEKGAGSASAPPRVATEGRKFTASEIVEILSRDGEDVPPPPNIGVTIGDWAKAVSEARRAAEMYAMFIAEQNESGSGGQIDFKRVISFLSEQHHIVCRALKLAESEQVAKASILCGLEQNELLGWAFWGINFVSSSASVYFNGLLADKKDTDPFDNTTVLAAISSTVVAGASQYASDRVAAVRKKEEKVTTRLEKLIREATVAKKYIEAHLTRYRAFVDVRPEEPEEDLAVSGGRGASAALFFPASGLRAASSVGAMSRTAHLVREHGMRGAIERMVEKLREFTAGEDGMTRKDCASMLVQQYAGRFPDLCPDDFTPTSPEEFELFKAFVKMVSSQKAASAGESGCVRSYPAEATHGAAAAAAHDDGLLGAGVGVLGRDEEVVTLDEELGLRSAIDWRALEEGVTRYNRRPLIDHLVAAFSATDGSDEVARRLVEECYEHYPLLRSGDFSNISTDLREYKLLEAFFRVKAASTLPSGVLEV